MKKKSRQPVEGERQSMSQLTKNHDQFMKGRNLDRQEENDDAKEKFESLISKSVKPQR